MFLSYKILLPFIMFKLSHGERLNREFVEHFLHTYSTQQVKIIGDGIPTELTTM